MYLKLSFLTASFISALQSETLIQLEQLSPNPLYFNIPITEYRIVKSEGDTACQKDRNCPVNVGIDFGSDEITTITDRPIRQTSRVSISEFMDYFNYVKSKGQEVPAETGGLVDDIMGYFGASEDEDTTNQTTDLVFTLDIRQNDKVVPVNFTIDNITYDQSKNSIEATSELNIDDDDLINLINANGQIIGDGAILSVEG